MDSSNFSRGFSVSFQKLTITILMGLLTSLNAVENTDREEKIVPSAYDFKDSELNKFKDLDKKKLTDGITEASSRIIWSWRSIGKEKPLEINFQLQMPEVISKVKVHTFRGEKGYGIKRMSVYGILPDGNSIPLESKTLNQPYTKPKEEAAYSIVEIPLENKEKLSGVLLKVEGVSRVSLTEVEFFKKTSDEENTMSTNSFDFLGKKTSLSSGLHIEEKDFNNDGNKDILLENDYMLYVVEPVFGGVVNYAYDKQAKKNLVKYHDVSSWGGVFCDFVKRDGRNASDWNCASYKYEILSRGPEAVSLKLWKEGQSGQYAMISIDKTFTLSANATDLKADYQINLSPDNVSPMEFAFFSFNAFGSNTESWQVFYPEKNGVKNCGKGMSKNIWSHAPSQGWSGFVTNSGIGTAIVDEYQRLASHHFWPVDSASSVEAIFGQFPVDAGNSFKTTLYLVPFYGIGGVPDAVSSFMVAKIMAEEKYLKAPSGLELNLKASQPGDYSILIEKKLLPDGKWEKISEQNMKLSLKPVSLKFPFKAEKEGTYSIKASVSLGSRNVLMAEHPLTVGKASGEFAMSSPCERIIPKNNAEKELKLDFNSIEYATPHIKWAPSYAGGCPSVLFLLQEGGGRFAIREMIEMAQRFQMETHSSFIPLSDNKAHYYQLADHLWSLGPEGYLKHLEKMLADDRKYDVIVIPDNYWKILKDSLRKNIIERVRNGTGLVLLYPLEAPEELTGALKIEKEKRFKAFWKKEKEHFITTGVPFETLPASNVFENKANGEIIASANGKALIAVSEFGKGRIAAASWDGGPSSRSGYNYTYGTKGMLPKLSVIGDSGKKFAYWEYQLSLLAKMIYYAADKMPAVRGNSIQVSGDKLKIELFNSSDKEIKAMAELTIRDKYYRTETEKKTSVSLSPGKNNISITFENTALDGFHFADIRILTDDKTQWWGTEAFNVKAPAAITDILFDKEVYKRNESAKIILNIDGKLPENAMLEVSLKDAFGRVFAEVSKKASVGKNSIEAPLKNSLGPYMETHIKLMAPGSNKIISEESASALLFTVSDTSRFTIMVGWPETLYRGNLFLVPFYYRMLKELWGWNFSWAPKFQYPQEIRLMAAEGIPLSISRASFQNAGSKHPDTTAPGKGKYGLLRTPCLSNAKFRKDLEKSHESIALGEELGAICRIMPDEANSIGKWQGCFSDDCLKEFRKWLKTQYSSLDELNREWDSSFKNWDEVEAKLDTEITSRKSIAPWLDHRTFNEWNYANAFRLMSEGIKTSGTNSRIMMCGTQETKNYNAYDWYLLTKYVNSYNSYVGEQSVMRRSFTKDYLNYTWVGYGNDLKYLRHRMLARMFDDNAKGYVLLAQTSINPDWTLHKTGKDLITLKEDFGEGRGELIIRSECEAAPVAFHYSPASIHVNSFYNRHDIYTRNIAGAKDALKMKGCDYAYIAYKELEEKPEVLEKYRLLFLPLSSALSETEINNLEKFVGNGGTVIADFLPGEWTRHGRKRDNYPLEKLFGIKTTEPEIKVNSGIFQWNGETDSVVEVNTIQTGLELTTGKSLAVIKDNKQKEYPAIIVNKYGKGNTVLLCGDILSSFGNWKEMKYTQKRKPATEKLITELKELFSLSGIKADSWLQDKDGNPIPLSSIYRRNVGKIRLFAVIRENTGNLDKKEKTFLPLDSKYYVYKVLFDKPSFLGYTDKVEFETSPTTQTLLAVIPYKVTGISFNKKPEAVKPGQCVEFSISLKTNPAGEGDKHVVCVKVIAPDGKERKEYEKVLSRESGKTSFFIPFALNDPKGAWTIKALDVATGISAETSFPVN